VEFVQHLLGCDDLLGSPLALDREHHAADPQERNGHHREAVERPDRARSGDIELLAQWAARDRLRALLHDGDIREPEPSRHRLEEARLLARRLEERPGDVGARDRERDRRKPAARTDVDRGLDLLERGERREEREAVDDMPAPGALTVDARQVEALVGHEEHAEKPREERLLGGCELDPEPRELLARRGVARDRRRLRFEREPSRELGLACRALGGAVMISTATGFSHRIAPHRIDSCLRPWAA